MCGFREDTSGSGQNPVMGLCEEGNGHSDLSKQEIY